MAWRWHSAEQLHYYNRCIVESLQETVQIPHLLRYVLMSQADWERDKLCAVAYSYCCIQFGVRRRVFTARRYASAVCRRRVSVCVCVCVCMCLSHALRHCMKTAKHRITQIMMHDSPLTLVFWCQRSRRNSNWITPYWGNKCRWGGLKLVTFDEKRAITRKRYKIDS